MDIKERWNGLKERERVLGMELAKLEERKKMNDEQIKTVKDRLRAMNYDPDCLDLDAEISKLESTLVAELDAFEKELVDVEQQVQMVKSGAMSL